MKRLRSRRRSTKRGRIRENAQRDGNRRVPAWRRYESRAKLFFRSLAIPGCEVAKLEVDGVRGHHEVDVVVSFTRFGIPHRWVVECKRHRSKVTKAMVLTLVGVVEDVGADRGFLLSEVGFQPGAIEIARLRNITLTSLSELKRGAAADIIDGKVASLQQRFARAQVGLVDRLRILEEPEPGTGAHYVTTAPGHGEVHVYGVLVMCEHALKQGLVGQFPVRYPDPVAISDIGSDNPQLHILAARDWGTLVAGLDKLISSIESWIARLPAPDRVSGVLVALAEAVARRTGTS